MTPPGQPPSIPIETKPATQPKGRLIDNYTIDEPLTEIKQGIDQMNADITREQGRQGSGKIPLRARYYEKGPEPPYQEPERDRDRGR